MLPLPSLTAALERVAHNCNGYRWNLCEPTVGSASPDHFAELLAVFIMCHRTRGAHHIFDLWVDLAYDRALRDESNRSKVEPYIRPIFGLPDDELPTDHVQAVVGEYLWWGLTLESSDQIETLRVTDPGFRVTDAGGDGLAFHRLAAGGVMFRLWEVKKHTQAGHVSRTIGDAYGQLKSNATEYLAQYTALIEHEQDADVARVGSHLVDLWVDEAPEAAAGVAVATDHRPQRAFTTITKHFPALARPYGLEGLIASIPDFQDFARKVQLHTWTALSIPN
jgi:hypothetical protein